MPWQAFTLLMMITSQSRVQSLEMEASITVTKISTKKVFSQRASINAASHMPKSAHIVYGHMMCGATRNAGSLLESARLL